MRPHVLDAPLDVAALRAALGAAVSRVCGPNVTDVRALWEVGRGPSRSGLRAALAGVARLLARLGDPASLRALERLSFVLLEAERSERVRTGPSSLYRGIAHLGAGDPERGLASVLGARRQGGLAPEDEVLAAWALVSEAVSRRDVGAALERAAAWGRAADRVGDRAEASRARRACAILAWLRGEGEAPPPEAPGAAPLLLGHAVEGSEPLPSRPDAPLAQLVAARRAFALGAMKALTPPELRALAALYARWHLAAPLQDAEALLRVVDPEAWQDDHAARLLGAAVAQASRSTLAPARREDVIIWMSDVRGYSSLSEGIAPERLFELLEPGFRIIHEELECAGGVLVEFVGDAVLLAFGAFGAERPDAEAILARTGRLLRRMHWSARLALAEGRPPIRIGAGLMRGPAAAGFLGGLDRCHLSTLGHTVNVAARLESLTKDLPAPCAVAGAIFGPSGPRPWERPDAVTYALRDLGGHRVKNVAAEIPVYGLSPLLRHAVEFAPMGFVARAEPGVVYLDTGNAAAPGIVDTHADGAPVGSSCELLLRRPALLLDHVRGLAPEEIELRVHAQPDLDCAAALYVAQELLEADRRRRAGAASMGWPRRLATLRRLAKAVSAADRGVVPAPDRIGDSLQAIFAAHLERTRRRGAARDVELLEAGLRVVDAACFLADRLGARVPVEHVFAAEPSWFPEERALLAADRAEYARDRARAAVYEARVGGRERAVPGIWLERPRSILFKLWARSDAGAGRGGFQWMVVDASTADASRFVLSVAPDRGLHLRGLGEALEAAESRRRRELGKERPVEPRRLPADNSDPWYFGQGHEYTIVDAPARGTVLTAEEVRAVHRAFVPASAAPGRARPRGRAAGARRRTGRRAAAGR